MSIQILLIDQGRVRPVWRFFLSAGAIVVTIIAAQIILGFILGAAGVRPDLLLANALGALVSLPALLGVFALFMRGFEGRPLGASGLALGSRWRAELGLGLAVGTLMILAVAAVEWAAGAAEFSSSGSGPRTSFLWGIGLLVVLALAATNEELIFRGYPFQRLVESMGPVAAISLLSLAFGAIHLGNPNSTWVGAANTALVGIPFSVAYLRTRMLWLPIGMHFSWNFVQGYVLGLPVSGITVPVSLLRAEVAGNQLLTGGAYGPEGGLLATASIVLATGYLGFSKSIYVSDDTRALVFGPAKPAAPERVSLALEDSPQQPNAGARE